MAAMGCAALTAAAALLVLCAAIHPADGKPKDPEASVYLGEVSPEAKDVIDKLNKELADLEAQGDDEDEGNDDNDEKDDLEKIAEVMQKVSSLKRMTSEMDMSPEAKEMMDKLNKELAGLGMGDMSGSVQGARKHDAVKRAGDGGEDFGEGGEAGEGDIDDRETQRIATCLHLALRQGRVTGRMKQSAVGVLKRFAEGAAPPTSLLAMKHNQFWRQVFVCMNFISDEDIAKMENAEIFEMPAGIVAEAKSEVSMKLVEDMDEHGWLMLRAVSQALLSGLEQESEL